jgi:sulfur-carrier protein
MRVQIPSPLASYTAGRREVDARGSTLGGVVADLERQFPGIRFRIVDEQDAIRPHIKIFVNRAQAPGLAVALAPGDEVLVVAALSGG